MNLISKGKSRVLVSLLISSSLVFSSFTSYADSVDDMENTSSELENELASIDKELFSISEKILETKSQITITDAELKRTEDLLAESIIEEEQQYDAMKARIKYMYESGSASLLEMIFSAENLSDFVNRADFASSVSSYDRKMLTELSDVRKDIEDQKEDIYNQKSSLKELETELSNKETSLKERASAVSFDLESYKAKIASAKEAERKRKEEEQAKQNSQNQGSSSSSPSGGGTVNNSSPPVNASTSEVELFAAILQCEAHNEYNSLLAVATVIMNRVESPRFPNTLYDVIYAPGQFEPTWSGRLDRVLSQGANPLPRQVAQDALNGARLAEVSDCYYFLYAGATSRPGVNVGDNLFFQSW